MILLALATSIAWVETAYKDPIDDHEEVSTAISGNGVTLSLTCTPRAKRTGSLFVSFEAPEYLGADGWAEVSYRFDTQPAKSVLWDFSQKAVTNEETIASDDFSIGLSKAAMLTFRVVDTFKVQHDFVIRLPKDSSSVNRVRSACRYKTY